MQNNKYTAETSRIVPATSVGSGASCSTLTVDIPTQGNILSVHCFARERAGAGWGECQRQPGGWHPCPVGWSAFDGNYQLISHGNYKTVSWMFNNWSHNRDREARLVVTYSAFEKEHADFENTRRTGSMSQPGLLPRSLQRQRGRTITSRSRPVVTAQSQDSPEEKFTKAVTDSVIANWLGLASNLIGVGQYLFGLFSGGPELQDVLNKLDDLSFQITDTYFLLRNLILRETARIIDEIDTQGQIQELAKASTAYGNLKEYRRSGNIDILEMAFTLSQEPCVYFRQLTSPSSLASFVYCVDTRIDVIRSYVVPAYYTQPLYIDEINTYIRHLTDLIQNASQFVEDTHQVSQVSQSVGKPPTNGYFRDFYIHTQTILRYPDDPQATDKIDVELGRIEFEFEDAFPHGGRTLPTQEEAAAAIERDRATGVQQELDFLGIPRFITIRDNWRRLLDQGLLAGGGVNTA